MPNAIKVPVCFTSKDHGFAATGFAKSAVLRQLGFHIGVAVMRDSNPERQKAAFDAATMKALGEDDNGQTKPIVLDVDNLCVGYAAAFRMLRNHTKLTNPESGKPDEHLLRFLVKPSNHIERAAQYSRDQNAASNIAQTKANAKALYPDLTPEQLDAKIKTRVDAIIAEAAKSITVNATPADGLFLTYLGANKDEDSTALLNMALTSLAAAGSDASTVIRKASDAYADAMRKRLDNGLFVKIDTGIIALAKMV